MGAPTEHRPDDRPPSATSTAGRLPLSGEPLPLDLVNTTFIRGGVRGRLLDALAEPADLDHWLSRHRPRFSDSLGEFLADPAPAGDAHLARFLELRLALRSLAGASARRHTPEAKDAQVVNRAARLASHWHELALGSPLTALPRWPEPDPLLVALGEIAAQAIQLFTGQDADKVRACPAPGCVLYFLKSPARREWCTTACGNRVRVARHSRRTRDGAQGH
ncbi:CGNR zinc finger domain-containing protein [Streptomyces sp. NPDC051561]|uniref:CGNR zinc finger domain-containing protein n=1 Tax=Streptomyces sp. NPDC051561 TaxID=3365658 RepID=UPI00378FF7DD